MGTTAQKLQKLVEGKQAIVNAVNSKANTSLSINSKLSDVASAISNISGSGGIPEGYIKPSGNKEITSNGNYDITEFASVSVNVPTNGSAGGTAVPNTGYIEKVYFNTALSNEEVVSILSKLTYIQTPLFAHPLCGILFSNDGNPIVIAGTIGEGDDIGYYITIITDMNNMEYVNAFDYNNLVEDGWKLNECSVNKEVISEYEGLPIGTQNELIKTLVSTTPFGGSSCDANGLPLEVDSLPGSGTAVPNSGYIEKVYFNTSLSNDEVVKILSNINYNFMGYMYIGLTSPYNEELEMASGIQFAYMDGMGAMIMSPYGYVFAYMDGSTEIEEVGFSGWNPDFNGIIEFNSEALSTFEGDGVTYSVGDENDKLSNLFSATPFGDSTGVEGAIYKVSSEKKQFSDLYINIPSSGMSNKLSNWYTILGCETVDEKPLEDIKESTEEEFYIYYDKSANDVFIYIDIGYGLMWVNCSSMLEAANFPGLTFKGEITNINQATEEGYYVFISSGGEVVPNSGFVKQVYLNTNLSVEKVKSLIDEVAQEIEPGAGMYVAIYNGDEYMETDQQKGLILGKVSDGAGGYQYFMMTPTEEGGEDVFAYYDGSSEIEASGYSGWNPDFKGVYEFNFEATNTAYGGTFTVGESNDKLMDLLSLTSTFGSNKTTYYLFENGEFKRFLSSDEAGLPIEVNELPSTDFLDVMVINEVSGEISSFKQVCITELGVHLKCITVETEPNPDELILFDPAAKEAAIYYIKDRNDLFVAGEYEGSRTLLPFSLLANEDSNVPEYTFLGTYLPGVSNKHGYYIVPGQGDVTEGAIYKVNGSNFQAYVYEEGGWINFSFMAIQNGGKITINLVDTIPDASQMELSDLGTFTFVFYYVEGDDRGYATFDGVETFTTLNMELPPVGGIVQSVSEMTDTSKMYIAGKKGGYYIYENGWKELIPADSYNSGSSKPESSKPEQEKSVTPTTSIQEVTPDSGYTLSKVTVDAIPSHFIVTRDATATSTDILKDKSAYVNDKKIVGTIETYNGENENGAVLDDMLQPLINRTSSCRYLFYNYKGTNADFINDLDTSYVTSMDYMFGYCTTLASIPQLNTRNVTDMSYMFYYCSSLTTIPQLNTIRVTNMSYMFGRCSALTTIPQLNTNSVLNMESMFSYCTTLASIPQLNTNNVTNMYRMFMNCSSLTTIPQLNTIRVTNMSYMFYNCSVLETIDITYYNISSTGDIQVFAAGCTALKALIIRSFGTTYILSTDSLKDSGIANGTGYIYVPRTMVDKLKSKTNWSTYASQIRALEDYTVDGTNAGELDSTKI